LLFERGIHLPAAGLPPLSIRRIYSPVHNIGHFRFLECSHRGLDGSPSGEVALWDEIYFPYDPRLQTMEELKPVSVTHFSNGSHSIEELYECDSGGSITVTISDLTTNCRRITGSGIGRAMQSR
jgi:hypothetical protein